MQSEELQKLLSTARRFIDTKGGCYNGYREVADIKAAKPASARTQRFLIFPALFLALFLGITACANSARISAADVQKLTQLAKEGDATAQNDLGLMYGKGHGVTQDYKKAAKWFKLAAEQGHINAQNLLGLMHAEGQGVTQDYKEALKWWRKAAAQNYGSAQYSLGVMYHNGFGVAQSDTEAVQWYRLAASQGDASAQNNLGAMYAFGQGVSQDYVLAYMWANLAAASGNKIAVNLRNELTKELTASQIKKAEKLSKECKARNYKNC